jgi:hypothetical protein
MERVERLRSIERAINVYYKASFSQFKIVNIVKAYIFYHSMLKHSMYMTQSEVIELVYSADFNVTLCDFIVCASRWSRNDLFNVFDVLE